MDNIGLDTVAVHPIDLEFLEIGTDIPKLCGGICFLSEFIETDTKGELRNLCLESLMFGDR
jgi:hypothetical protein